jgi:hypothetical protein
MAGPWSRSLLLLLFVPMGVSQYALQEGANIRASRRSVRDERTEPVFFLAGKSPWGDAARGFPPIQVVMASVSRALAHYDPDTRTWKGFAPDFLKMLSNDLGFPYAITDERSLCELVKVEYFRAVFAAGIDGPCKYIRNGTIDKECCVLAGTKEYADRDLKGFRVVPSGACNGDLILMAAAVFSREWDLCYTSEFAAQLRAAPWFPFVYKDGPKKGETLRAVYVLNTGVGEHPLATPPNLELLTGEGPRMWGMAMPTTPMYTEEVQTLVFTTTADSMWNLFVPFTWELWVAVASMVRPCLLCVATVTTLPTQCSTSGGCLIDVRVRAGDPDGPRGVSRDCASENTCGPHPGAVARVCEFDGPRAGSRDHRHRFSHRCFWVPVFHLRTRSLLLRRLALDRSCGTRSHDPRHFLHRARR